MYDDVYEKAEQIMRERRNAAVEENRRRNAEIDSSFPDIVEIKNKQMKNISSRLINIIKSGDNVQTKLMAERRMNNQAICMIRAYLKKYGYPENYLEIHYNCPKCSDTGYHDGKRCECMTELLKKLSVENINTNTNLQLSTFDTFNLGFYDEKIMKSMQKIYNYCVDYARNFEPGKSSNIMMYGSTGLGKTHLSLAIGYEVILKGYSVAYDSAINFLRHIENEHFGRSVSAQDTLENIINADLLIMDDLGAEYESRFYSATIYNIINTRINLSRPTIISTNLDFTDIEQKYDMRITSRIGSLFDYLKFLGSDIRFLKRTNKEL